MLIKLSTARALIKEEKKDIFPRTFLDLKKRLIVDCGLVLTFFRRKYKGLFSYLANTYVVINDNK